MSGSFTGAAIAYLKADLSRSSAPADLVLAADDAPVVTELGNGLLVTYLVDQGDSFEYVLERHLKSERIGKEALCQIAVGNLALLAQRKLRVSDQGDFHAVLLDGNFEASLLLVDPLWDQVLARLVDNEFLACIPARDVLAFCDSRSATGADGLRAVVDRVWPNGDHLLTRSLYRRSRGAWHSLSEANEPPSAAHP